MSNMLIDNEQLMAEWDYEKNKNIDLSSLKSSSTKKVWWKCPKGHSYYSYIYTRVNRNSGCPYCANQKILTGYNDLATTNPELIKEWDYSKNFVKPTEVMRGSARKVWWKCPKGHSYEAKLNNKTSKNGTACPYCTNYKVLSDFNDLATTNPELIKYWDDEKNGSLKPNMVMKGQHKEVWWIGECGHSWKSTIYHMVEGKRCPICNIENKSSFPEQAIYFYLKKVFDEVEIENRKVLNGKELDIYIPSIKTAIEFDGDAWHKNVEKDIIKNQLCIEKGIRLIRIRDEKCPILPQLEGISIIYNKDYSDTSITKSINKLFEQLDIKLIVDTEKDRSSIYSQYLYSKKKKSLMELGEERLIREWDYDKNNNLTPEMVSYKSNKKVWWKCSNGHSWQAPVSSRTNLHANCPYCSGRIPIAGENDLATTNPELAKEWDYNKNNDLTPKMVSSGSGKRVWWICSKGHSYKAYITNRTIHNTGCPYCIDEKKIEDSKKIFSNYSYLLTEWDYEKNNDFIPEMVTRGCSKKIWWKCPKGHSYDALILNRINGRKCPYCSNHKVLSGYNDLATTNPELMKEWDYDKNTVKPTEVMRGSAKKVWWKCSSGHSFLASIYSHKLGSCSVCNNTLGKRVLNVDTGEIFNSLTEAAKSCGLISGDSIGYCCKGKQLTAGGYHWKYLD